MMPFYCLMSTGNIRLSEGSRDQLLVVAVRMINSKRRRGKLFYDEFHGVVETEFENVSFAGIAGFLFYGEVFTEKGSTKIKYVVAGEGDEREAERGRWTQIAIPMRRRRRRYHEEESE